MTEFKVGDKVMLKDWEKFYEILEVSDDSIKLKSNSEGYYFWFNMTVNNFEKEHTMKFDPSKKYRMVDTHEPVRIICTDKKDPATPYIGLRAADPDYEVVMYLYENDSRIEEVPQVDWSKVEVDTPIWVDGMPMHFAEFHNGRVWFFQFGRTSHSLTTGTEAWCYPEHASLENPYA